LDNGHDSLVLGAWGCGVFKQRPVQIASMFLQILDEPEFKNKFKDIRFAVIGTKNVMGFEQVIEGFDTLQFDDRPDEWWQMCPKSEWRAIPDTQSQIKFIKKYIEFLSDGR